MANIRIKDLPVVTSAETADKIVIDGATTRSITIQNFLAQNGARFFVQPGAPSTANPNGSLWIDSDTPNLDLYQLVASVWTDTGLDVKGAPGADGSGAPANPTATIGLTAVNGSAVTYIRSDGAPALSQAISPTWTGTHRFTNAPAPTTNDGAALGTTSLQWSDAFLASGAVINYANGNFTITHSSGLLTMSGALSIGTANALTAGTVELGHATDTTLARVSAGVASVEGKTIGLLGVANDWAGSQQYQAIATIADGANLSWTVSSGQKAKVTIAGNRTVNAVTGAVDGASYFLWVIQDGTGSRTLTWTTTGAGSFDFGTDGAPTLTTTASRADLLCFEAISIGGTLKLRFAGIKKGFA